MSKNNFIKASEPQQVSNKETEIILSLARQCTGEGDFCEFGCYRGDTSLLLERLLEQRRQENNKNGGSLQFLWIYDSFEGLPPKTSEDSSVAGDSFQAGELLVTKKEVVERFKKAGLKVPRIRKGFFDQLDSGANSHDLPDKIAFAFLDGDLYQSIKTSLDLVSPRLQPGSIVIVHDYNNPQLPGVAKAVEEWLATTKISPTLQVRETLAILKI
ncbi:class I SAM-dependent methyltransferase [Candidatus Saccharibacteria bacterium]|nr:class I SAM-dependent methyltransferase [Candidatus Saccharibacteria bacterium]